MVSAQPSLWDAPAPTGPQQPVAVGERTHESGWALRSPDGVWHVRFGSDNGQVWWARTSAMRSSQWELDAGSFDEAVTELCDIMACSPPGSVGWADRRERHSPVGRGEDPATDAASHSSSRTEDAVAASDHSGGGQATAATGESAEAATSWRIAVVDFGHVQRWLPKPRIAGTAEEALAQAARSNELGIGTVRAGQTSDGRIVAEAFDFGRQATLRAVEIDNGRAAERGSPTVEAGL